MGVACYLSFAFPLLSISAVAFCANSMRPRGLCSFGLDIAEVTSTSLPGLLPMFPCHVQKNSLSMEKSWEVGASLSLSLTMSVSANAIVDVWL